MTQGKIYTVGQADRTSGELVSMLVMAGIETVVDIRASPDTGGHAHLSQASLRQALEAEHRVYHWAGRQLGGDRQPRADSPHVALHDEALRGFADYMAGAVFQRGVVQLINLASRAPLALLSAERLPEHGHRSLIADYLTLRGIEVAHLIEPGTTRQHQLSLHARRESAELIYDRG